MAAVRFGRPREVLIEVGAIAHQDWETFDVDASEAALALGDGFNLMSAIHERSMLHQTTAAWRAAGLGCVEGLHWHQAGFTVKQTLQWRARNHNVSPAMAIRAGYVKEE